MKILETERLRFVHYDEDLYEDFIRLFTNEDVMKFVDKGVLSRAAADALWHRLTKEFYPQGIKTIWAVTAKDDGRFIGNASLRPRPSENYQTEAGYMLMPAEWGKGFATEIAQRLIKFGFDELDLHAVYATVDVENKNSIRVLEKCGMVWIRTEYDKLGNYYLYGVGQ
jgi:[ribosomal protein S5]-alanine N-acetyltransferase